MRLATDKFNKNKRVDKIQHFSRKKSQHNEIDCMTELFFFNSNNRNNNELSAFVLSLYVSFCLLSSLIEI